MRLADFIGNAFNLTGVDTFSVSRDKYGSYHENCQVINFVLNEVVYSAIEDPSDGYRSCLDRIERVTDVRVKNRFPPCAVKAKWHRGEADRDDVVAFYDINTGRIVLEIGTRRSDDYYPCFVGHFDPTAMTINTMVAARKPSPANPPDWGTW